MNTYATKEGGWVARHDNGSNITYVIYGSADQRKAEAARLMNRYPKAGYGTSISETGDTTTVERYASCD